MSDWIPHDGGKCPVEPDARVEVRRRMDGDYFDGGHAKFFCWEKCGDNHDILAYRLIDNPAPVDREFRRAVFLAVLPTMVDWDWSSSEKMMQKAWELADEAIAQEGA